jgi:hypothetical protein
VGTEFWRFEVLPHWSPAYARIFGGNAGLVVIALQDTAYAFRQL